MPLDRRAAADALDELAELLELRGENPFRVRAFANGARLLRGMADFDGRLAAGTLTEVKGIGKGLAAEVEALARTGASPLLEESRAAVAPGLREIRRVPGLGPKKARLLHDEMGIRSLAELEYACRENRLKGLKGFGEKLQAKVRESIAAMRGNEGWLRRDDVRALERKAQEALRPLGGSAIAAGAYRRGETLSRGVTLVLSGPEPEALIGPVLESLPVEAILDREDECAAVVRLQGGAEAELVAAAAPLLGSALLMATGPEEHLDALAALGSGRIDPFAMTAAGGDEAACYRALGLPFIPPEQRGDGSTIEAARAGRLPRLLERSEIRGAVHVHTTWSDGSGSVAEMLDAARGAGLAWVGMTDHSPTASYAGGLSKERVALQQAEIEAEASKRKDLVVFKGTECDILGDGALDYDEETLRRFDFLVASVHSRFTMPREEMTARVLKAIANPHTTVLGHPTGRLLLGRKGYEIDVPEVLRACARAGVAVELNAHPARLDLDPEWMPLVKELRVTVSLGPDSHEPEGLADLDHGVAVARRAGLPPDLVLNTRDAAGAREFFRKGRR